ncbi:MAG: hypothetical protein ACOYIB_00410 [Desulfosporosinus sp.]|jgi:hypothetical protein
MLVIRNVKRDSDTRIKNERITQTVAFWTKREAIKDLVVEVTVASTALGVCWLGFSRSGEGEQALRT